MATFANTQICQEGNGVCCVNGDKNTTKTETCSPVGGTHIYPSSGNCKDGTQAADYSSAVDACNPTGTNAIVATQACESQGNGA